jgi:gliding motility associated protien GldN
MKKSIFLFLLLFSFSIAHSQNIELYYNSDLKQCVAERENNLFHGKYTSWHPNGVKKSQGEFENNFRTGIWMIWDSTGQLRMERNYTSPFEFEIVQLIDENSVSTDLTPLEKRELIRDENNLIIEPELTEKDIVWAKRLWRDINFSETNSPLFNDNLLFSIIHKNILNGKLLAYDVEEDDFTRKLSIDEYNEAIERWGKDIIGFKLKEDCFYHKTMQSAETRILGICPVVKVRENAKRLLVWIYYPALREILCSYECNVSNNSNIKTIEDVFFFRHFSSEIYKESNVYDRQLSDYLIGDDIKKEALKIEVRIIEAEHDIWIK